MNEYEQQAIDFLNANGLTVEFVHTGIIEHPVGSRNTYIATINRVHGSDPNEIVSFEFTGSAHDCKNGIEPTAYHLLACIQKYEVGSLDEFMSDYGYFPISSVADYESAVKTYNAVKSEWVTVKAFFCGSELEQLREIN